MSEGCNNVSSISLLFSKIKRSWGSLAFIAFPFCFLLFGFLPQKSIQPSLGFSHPCAPTPASPQPAAGCVAQCWCSTLVRGAHHCSACWVLLQKMYGNNPFFSVLNWGLLSWQSSPCCVYEGCLGTARTEARTELSHPRNVLISIHPQNSINNNFLLQHQL